MNGAYQRKPELVKAIRYTGDNSDEVIAWGEGDVVLGNFDPDRLLCVINDYPASVYRGEWITLGTSGVASKWSEADFAKYFEPIGGDL